MRDGLRMQHLRILDIGCGGGLLCEPLAALGGTVVGADPAPGAIEAARLHARGGGLAIDYRGTTAEARALQKQVIPLLQKALDDKAIM